MKTLLLCLFLLTIGLTQVFAAPQFIICGSEPGEIYFSGLHPLYFFDTGFYYSADSGQTLELRGYVNPDCTSAYDFGYF